jgi:hypothetical protein
LGDLSGAVEVVRTGAKKIAGALGAGTLKGLTEGLKITAFAAASGIEGETVRLAL